MKALADVDIAGKRVLIRVDFNVPISDGRVTSDARMVATLPTIRLALERGAAVILMSHLGRPKEGQFDVQASLQPVAEHLSTLLAMPVAFASDWLSRLDAKPGSVTLCENVRFNIGEADDDEALSKQMAALCDVFVMDAFGTAHRAQASTHGVAKYAPVACAGPLLQRELEALGCALEQPKGPVVAIVGGSKVSTKLTVLDALSDQVDHLIVGGGIANTFLAAVGHPVGHSLYESDLLEQAKRLIQKMSAKGGSIPLPVDVRVAKQFDADASAEVKLVADVAEDDMILDIGPETEVLFAECLAQSGTIIWNGPVGVFEFSAFAEGTNSLAQSIANSTAFSIAGGGDTLAAIDAFGVAEQISYISTGGGAFLEYVEGKTLPAVSILQTRA